ncbi:uncharacterized protein IWZ02DRAFT_67408 [Phyllosticta citriasiana]|uniref:uncharacterized protein n=1 Tax=Phyllosticta citriasiana TaxID=595635 RepID=UPI0030FDA4D2
MNRMNRMNGIAWDGAGGAGTVLLFRMGGGVLVALVALLDIGGWLVGWPLVVLFTLGLSRLWLRLCVALGQAQWCWWCHGGGEGEEEAVMVAMRAGTPKKKKKKKKKNHIFIRAFVTRYSSLLLPSVAVLPFSSLSSDQA